jgi:CDP-glycerol glycerophosphotransferase
MRMHYLISNALDLRGYEDFAIDVSNYSDISELYLIIEDVSIHRNQT